MSQFSGRVVRFVIIGLASTGLYFAMLLALRPVIGLTAVLAAVCYATSMAFNYVAQALWTFRAGVLSRGSLGRYSAVQGSALVTNSAAMTWLVDGVGFPLIPAQIVVTALVAGGVYALSIVWVYR